MTPKHKAKALVDIYFVLANGFLTFQQVKQCALIAVDEILNSIRKPMTDIEIVQYWLEVKQEIEKL